MAAAVNGFGDRAVAVVGVGCRLPGGIADLDGLWSALDEGRDLVGEVPADRFDPERFVDRTRPRPGKSYTAAGGFLDDIASFDADYFGISPKEAAQMDPQHRLLLELTAEALDDAGIDPARLAGTPAGVFVGISDASYGALQMMSPTAVNAYTASGAASSIAANRLSHAFDLRGPSVAMDTACSSSLVALERACEQVAAHGGVMLAGGANVLVGPYVYIAFSQASMLSAAGRCAAFSAGADGFVRAEGGGMVVLKRLADAVADGDRIHGVLAGWGSNSDGRTAGLALPSAAAQEGLLREVYAAAGADPDELVYVEAHGTGTPVGDPAECTAIGRALAQRRSRPLPLGSVKSNLGHLEPASGMAGLFKALLVLRHGRIPVSLHAAPLNPRIDFDGLNLTPAVAPAAVEPPARGRRLAGVNSFGFGGTNAHVIVAAPPEPSPAAAAPAAAPAALPVVVSARTPEALESAAARLAHRLAGADPAEFRDLAFTSCARRGAHPLRRAVLAADPQNAARQLAQPPLEPIAPAASDGRVAFVYCGNGSQWAGMGADLLAGDPVFAGAVAEADAALEPHLGWSVVQEMAQPPAQWRLERTEVAQPLLFAVQVGVTRMLQARGITPAAVAGHSVGEAAAAWAAGMVSLDQAARIVAARGSAQAPTAGSGRMAAAAISPDEAEKLLARHPGVEIAGINSDHDVTLAGSQLQLEAIAEELGQRGVFFRFLGLDYAFHSSAMDPVRGPLLRALEGLAPTPGRIPLASTATGGLVDGERLDAEHWWQGIRRPVLFAPAIAALRDSGIGVFAEIGPHPVLRTYLRRILAAAPERRCITTATLRRDTGGRAAMAAAVTSLIGAGADIDWTASFPEAGRVASLPAYPWQREHHWQGHPDDWARSAAGPVVHPLLGERLPTATPSWQGAVEPAMAPWLAEHRLAGSVVFPAAGYVEMGLAAAREVVEGPVETTGWEFVRPLVIPWEDAGGVHIQASLSPRDGVLDITGTDRPSARPRPHARGRVRRLLGTAPAPLDPAVVRERCPRHMGRAQCYDLFDRAGLGYGPAFRQIRDLWAGDGEALAAYRSDAVDDRLHVHPALLDGALQTGLPLVPGFVAGEQAYLPAAIGSVKVWRAPAATGWFHVRDRSRLSGELCWDVTVTDDEGGVCIELHGVRMRRLAGQEKGPVELRHTVLRAAPLPESPAGPSPLPAPEQIAARAAGRIGRVREAVRSRDYERFARRLRRITAHYVAAAIAGTLPHAATRFTLEDLEGLGGPGHHTRTAALLLPWCEAEGLVQPVPGGGLRLTTTDFRGPELVRGMLHTLPAYGNDVTLLNYLARRLPAFLRGEAVPQELITDDGPAELLRCFYAASPQLRPCYRVAQAFLAEMVDEWPQDRPLRVLEVGAGTAGLTRALLPLLPADRTHYTFTDISPFFLTWAQKRLADTDFLEYRTLDLDAAPEGQGFPVGGYDLVVAANALHTAADLEAALRRVSGLLAPGGRLLAVETHNARAAASAFGTLDDFWAPTDTGLRPDGAFLGREQWPPLLRRSGFEHVVQTGGDRAPHADDFSVLLAATPAEADRAAPALTAEAAAAQVTGAGVHHLVIAETSREVPLADATAAAAGGASARAAIAPHDAAAWAGLLAGLPSGEDDHVAITLILAEPEEEHPDPVGLTTRRAALLRGLAAACPGRGDGGPSRSLTLVTRPTGILPAPEKPEAPADAAVWGLARTLANERPDLPITRISLERGPAIAADAERIAAELRAHSPEDEIVLTPGGRFVPREVPHTPTVTAADVAAFTLRPESPGLNYRLRWAETDTPEPGPGTVSIAVRAAALNYRDVMQVTGLLPAEAIEGSLSENGLGLECSGVIDAVGPGVTDLRVGDRVFALAPACLASHAVTGAQAVGLIPDSMGFAEAATLPVVFATVQYALGHLARLGAGETVLVHGGAGGVGLAALQYARSCGARVIATAGSEVKRDLLRTLGVHDVLDSRSLDFAPQVMEATGGRGVDVVLNSLAGEAIGRGLELLRPGGRFVELGKRDIMEDNPLPLRPFHNNIGFFSVDLNVLLDRPEEAADIWRRVTERVHAGDYRPLPHTLFPAARVQDAFELLQHSRHIGKVVVAFDDLDEPVPVHPRPAPLRLDPDGTYLVTGGLGGFGAATARHLADNGARHLALASRRGADAPEAAALLADLATKGVRATAHAVDCADADALAGLVRDIDAGGHRLCGVVHAAALFDDADLAELTDERFAAVLAPKMGGLHHLDRLTRGRDLSLFCTYSSITAAFGNLRQANYVAANAYTEALIRRRRRDGDTGLAVAWGHIGDVGYVARNGLASFVTASGFAPMTPGEAFAAVGRLHPGGGTGVVGVTRSGLARSGHALPASAASPRLRLLFGDLPADDAAERGDLIARITALPWDQAREALAGHLTNVLAGILHTDPERLDTHRRLEEFGVDSLMGAELLMAVNRNYGLDMPPMELMRGGGTIADVSQTILLRLGLRPAADRAEGHASV
ncbi:SDR family NAD(P)-dependent oxidoreductase [Nocardiopsis sediminis]|uniref:SDR family NAD(P)-dependent oxidoreductase n=1 Tax=Nocardiopsis sediminis TaxID=1778267 RepID=A0ABV8FSL8_9ACTN